MVRCRRVAGVVAQQDAMAVVTVPATRGSRPPRSARAWRRRRVRKMLPPLMALPARGAAWAGRAASCRRTHRRLSADGPDRPGLIPGHAGRHRPGRSSLAPSALPNAGRAPTFPAPSPVPSARTATAMQPPAAPASPAAPDLPTTGSRSAHPSLFRPPPSAGVAALAASTMRRRFARHRPRQREKAPAGALSLCRRALAPVALTWRQPRGPSPGTCWSSPTRCRTRPPA